jgi:hypothetical protein
MAKRFTDTAKWKKEFIKGLSAKHKLLWFYILDDCDHAGIWEVDFEVASLRIGEDVNYEEAFVALGEQFEVIGKNRWWIRDFISFQYGALTEKNKMYKPVMEVLKKFNINPNIPHIIPHISPIDGGKVKDKDKVQVKVEVKDQGGVGEIETDDFKYHLKDAAEKVDRIEETLLALDELYIDQERPKWSHIDFDFEVKTFREKVRGSPEEYENRDTSGIRLAFQYQLRNAKKKIVHGTKASKNDRTEFNQNELAIIQQHAAGSK